jgi:N-acetylmuramoyl-L-alanine amidase
LKDVRTNNVIDKMYEELSLEEKRNYLNWVPNMIIEKEVPKPLFEKMTTKKMAVWINGKASSKEEIKKYKRTDFNYYTYSFVHKNARTKRFPQEYQYTLYTKKYFDQNLKNSHLHFSNDTLKMVISELEKEWKKVDKILSPKVKADTVVWYTKEKESYNLYVNEKKEKKIIVIDAGHGGQDFGATKEHLNEKNLTAEIAKKIKEIHTDSDVAIHFTRTNDEFLALNDRTNAINNLKPDLVLSLHINNNKNNNASGFEVFVSDKTEFLDKTKALAEQLSSKLSKTQLKNRGLKTAPFWILKKSDCPSMVVELGFISNENDRNFIASEKGQNEIAKHIVAFLSEIR